MLGNLAKSANEERVAIRSIKAKHVQPRPARSEVNLLPNPKDRGVQRNLQKPGCLSIGSRGIHLFVGVADLDSIVVLEYGEQRDSVQPGLFETRELASRKVAGLDGARFISAEPQAFELNRAALWRATRVAQQFPAAVCVTLSESTFEVTVMPRPDICSV